MSELINVAFISTFIAGCISAGMPLFLAAVGESVGELAGVLNLGIEGVMLGGAYVSYAVALKTDSIWLGMLAGIITGLLSSLIMLVLNVWLGLHQIVLGIAVTLAGGAITSVLYKQYYGKTSPKIGAPHWKIPGLSRIPVLGDSLFNRSVIFWLCLISAVAMAWLLTRTTWSLSTQAAGQKPASLDAAGGSVMRTRSQAVLIGGAFAGLGGAYLSLITTGAFTAFMTNGIGYLAIIVVMITRSRIPLVAAVSLFYGASVSIGTALQLTSIPVPTDVVDMLPYVAMMAILMVFARNVYIPPALAASYTRGSR